MYKPDTFLPMTLQAVLSVVSKDDPTLFSFHGPKIALLFLQEFIILNHSQYLHTYFECLEHMLGHL